MKCFYSLTLAEAPEGAFSNVHVCPQSSEVVYLPFLPILLFSLNSRELRVWRWGGGQRRAATIAATTAVEPPSSHFGAPNRPRDVLRSLSNSSSKVGDCNHLKWQRAVLPPPSRRPCAREAPSCQCTCLRSDIAYQSGV